MALKKRKKPVKVVADKTRVNRGIKALKVRVITDDGKQLGVLKTLEAIEIAEERGLDLVEVSEKTDPPVCKIMDYGKFKYQKSKKAHDAKKRQTVVKIKEIKLRPKTEEHDFQFKLKHARGFVEEGNKVKVTVQFRGREMAFTDIGIELLDRFAKEAEDISIVEVKPKAEGRIAQMIIAPKKT